MTETPFDLLIGLLALRFSVGMHPIFVFSIVDYAGQAVANLYLSQRLRHGTIYALGRTNVLLLASFSAYEAAFKLSFLLFGEGRVEYFLNSDYYGFIVLVVGIGSLLAIWKTLNLRAATLTASLAGALWILWVSSGAFPVALQQYESSPAGFPLTLIFNVATKTCICATFVVSSWSRK